MPTPDWLLWRRLTKKCKWRVVVVGEDEQSLIAQMQTLSCKHAQYLMLPANKTPGPDRYVPYDAQVLFV